jgi:hypothetical protein
MPEPILPLPGDHAFVLQLQESHGRPGICRAGRVVHLATGQAVTVSRRPWTVHD